MSLSLATRYLGLALKNPVVASASPLNSKLDNIRRLEDAGAGAVVLPSLFEEQIEAEAEAHDDLMGAYANSSPEAQTYFPSSVSGPYGLGPEHYLNFVRRARDAVGIPVIASLNGSSKAGWVDYAKLIEQAGAAAIELNMYHVPTDLNESGHDVEARYTDIVWRRLRLRGAARFRQALASSQLHRPLCQSARRARGPPASCCSTGCCNPTSIWWPCG